MRHLTWALGWKERALTADRRQEQACLFNNSNGKARCEREEGRGSAVSAWRARPLRTVETAMKRPGVGGRRARIHWVRRGKARRDVPQREGRRNQSSRS